MGPPDEPTPDWQQVKTLFADALERAPSERDAYLAARCAGNRALEASVRDLLDALQEAPDFLESRDAVDRAAFAALGLESCPALALGARMGPYEVVELLDAGGMGEVYRARDHRLGRDVALKVLHARPDGEAGPRLAAEARAAAAISDPNVVAVFDVGETGGVPFVVTELLEGETLGRRLRRAPVDVREAVALGIEIARGLSAVHAQGFVHRDLKPDNVFLTRQGGVKLLDFGVAKALSEGTPPGGDRAPSPGTPTRGSTVIGTPGYVAPEQLEGQPVDARADVFALGAVLHRMLALRPADASVPHGPLPPAVPVALARLVDRCLARAPEQRFRSAEEVRRALQAIAARPRRRRSRAAASVAAALAVVAVAWSLRASASRAPAPAVRSLAVLPLAGDSGGTGDAYLGEGIADGLAAQISRSRALRVLSRTTVAALARRSAGPREAARRLGVDALLAGSVRRSGQHVRIDLRLDRVATGGRLWEGTYEGALHDVPALLRTIAASLLSEVGGVPRPAVLPERPWPRSDETYEAFLRGRHLWNLRSAQTVPDAIDQFNRALQLDPLYAPAYTGLADAFATLGDMVHSMPHREAFARAEAAARRALALDPSEAEAHATLGHVRMHAWRWAEAEREFQLAIDESPGYAPAHHWRAYNLASQGRLDQAVATIRHAEQLDPLSPIIGSDVAQILHFAGRHGEAVAQARQTLQMHPSFAEARRVLFLALLGAGDRAAAARELATFARHPDGGPGASTGYAYARLGRRVEAERTLAALQAPRGRFIPPYELAVIHAGLGDRDRAFARLAEAVSTNDPESMILPVDPRLATLRGDPRFAAVLLRMDVE
jgi:TolB-like protein/tetratricopeptide (TPR) repeat protein